LDDQSFREVFAGSPIKRTGRDRFVRNVLIAIGNSGEAALVPHALNLLDDASPLVRAMAVWALGRLDKPEFEKQKAVRLGPETDDAVCQEWSN
jgi:epoxyqueuosine reductase